MINNEFNEFCKFWNQANKLSANPKNLDEDDFSTLFAELENYALHTIKNALSYHMKVNKYAPILSEILAIINPVDITKQHISADEAWPIAVASWDQDVAVVITSEIMLASDIAYEAGNGKDDTAARMAFRAAYERIIKTAQQPMWFVSLGNDKSKTEDVVIRAVQKGYLPKGTENKYRLEAPTTTVQKLIEGYVARVDVRKESLENIKNFLGMGEKKKEFKQLKGDQLKEYRKKEEIRRNEIVGSAIMQQVINREYGQLPAGMSLHDLPQEEKDLPEFLKVVGETNSCCNDSGALA